MVTHFNSQVTAIEADCVRCADGSTYAADTVIYAAGRKPRADAAIALHAMAPEFHQIGDCRSVGNIQAATSQAWSVARLIGRY